MSNSSRSDRTPLLEGLPALPGGGRLRRPLTGFAFWAAIALPFLHVPLVVTTGLSSTSTTTAFVALVTLNVLALLVGHSHSRD